MICPIPGPLRDRMEIISIAGYTELEKMHIAKDHLLVRNKLEEHGLTKAHCKSVKKRFINIVRYYTREAGVRSLERQLASICRKTAKIIVSGEKKRVVISDKNVEEFLGKTIFHYGQAEARRSSWCGNRSCLYNSRWGYACKLKCPYLLEKGSLF